MRLIAECRSAGVTRSVAGVSFTRIELRVKSISARSPRLRTSAIIFDTALSMPAAVAAPSREDRGQEFF